MLALLLGASLAATSTQPVEASDPCLSAFSFGVARKGRADVGALMGLRDIGGPADDEAPFTLSPDGSRVAVAVRRADPDRNLYCQAIFVIEIANGEVANPILVQGDVTLSRHDLPRMQDLSGGMIATLLPRWSPDGRWLAYLERRNGVMQIVRVPASGGTPALLTHSTTDILRFEWSADGSELFYEANVHNADSIQAVRDEERRGFRFDQRWMPEWRLSPFPKPSPLGRFAVLLSTGSERVMQPSPMKESDDAPIDVAESDQGDSAKLLFQGSGVINGPRRILISREKGIPRDCRDGPCALATGLWWQDSRTLIFASRAGWGNNLTDLTSWNIMTDEKHRLTRTADRIAGCRPAPAGLICAIEGSKTPRRLFLIDYRTGKRTLLFDPNPEWGGLDLGTVRRLFWRNDRGLKTFGDLVLPPGMQKASGLPLIVVGYRSRGFLRGGSGDLFPIYPLAAKGFAVLVYERPEQIGNLEPARSQAAADRRDLADWADKKSGASSIMTAIAMLEREGIIDPGRIGLTGFSDGVDKGSYTLIHNPVFKAVAFAGCCSDPVMVNASIGPYLSDYFVGAGYPAYKDRNSARVADYSLAANADKVDAPILVQVADREFLRTLEIEAAFRQAGKPLDIYVFPDEYHNLWQPAHRQAAYLRNMAWFDYQILHDGKGERPDLIKPVD